MMPLDTDDLEPPGVKHLKAKLRGNIIGMIFIFSLWPIVLPIWAFMVMRHKVKVRGEPTSKLEKEK